MSTSDGVNKNIDSISSENNDELRINNPNNDREQHADEVEAFHDALDGCIRESKPSDVSNIGVCNDSTSTANNEDSVVLNAVHDRDDVFISNERYENFINDDHVADSTSVAGSITDHSIVWYKSPIQVMAMLSNFSTSYNVVNISMVLPILEALCPGGITNVENVALCASSLLGGMILGQLIGGMLGDIRMLGRFGALKIVMILQIVASIGSASIFTSIENDTELFFLSLAVWRFILGVGAGGVYPLAAVLSAEVQQQQHHQVVGGEETTTYEVNNSNSNNIASQDTSNDTNINKQVHRVVLTFSTQGLGFIAAPLLTVPLLYITPSVEYLHVIWRIILGVGCIPGIILMILQRIVFNNSNVNPSISNDSDYQLVPTSENTLQLQGIEEETQHQRQPEPITYSNHTDPETHMDYVGLEDNHVVDDDSRMWEKICNEPHLFKKLVGTAGTWFLFDVLFYGNTLFQTIVIEAAFGGGSKTNDNDDILYMLKESTLNSLILTSIALPGYAVAGFVIGKYQSPKFVMLQGFAMMSILYFCIGYNWKKLVEVVKDEESITLQTESFKTVLLICLYGLTFFFANYGPNTTTFILPSLLYSPNIRTTLNGVSAASGKIGALIGATCFEPISNKYGNENVMLLCSYIALFAFLLTFISFRKIEV